MNFQMTTLKKEMDILGIYTIYYFEHDKNFYFAGERHDFWEMVYVDVGDISVVADNKGYSVHQGEIIFHKPMEFHALASDQQVPHNILIVTFSSESEIMKFFENKIFLVDNKLKKILSSLLEEARATFGANQYPLVPKTAEIGSQQLISIYLEQFLIHLIRSSQNTERKDRSSRHAKRNAENALIDSIKAYLENNVYTRILLSNVCREFNMSRSYICQLFKDSTGGSIIDYYIKLKISEAKRLIREGNLNFTQISELLCYTSIHHFTRSFKSVVGMSPSNYEKSVVYTD